MGKSVAEKDTAPGKGLLVICMAAFLVPFMGSSINLALPEIGRVFSMKAVTLTWMATAYIISTAIFQIPFARMADMLGRKKVFIAGVFFFTLCTLLCGFAPSGFMLILLRFFAGMGSAMMFGTNMAILTSLFPPNKRGRAFGINTAVVYLSLAVGPFVGGILTHYLGWQSIFFVCSGVGGVVIVLSRLFLKGEWYGEKGERFDLFGAAIYGIALFGLIFGFSKLPHGIGIGCLIGGILFMTLFVLRERRHAAPLLDVKLFSGNRVFALSSLASLINYAATAAIGFMLSLYLQYVRGFDAQHAGMILIAQACVQTVFSLISGPLSDRVPAYKLATGGMVVIVAGLAGLIFITPDTPLWMIVGLLGMLGVGFGIFSSPNTNVIMGSVDKKHYGQASAIAGTMRLTGQAFSMGIAGMVISCRVGNVQIVPALYPQFMESVRITFTIFVLLCLIGVYASSARGKGAGVSGK